MDEIIGSGGGKGGEATARTPVESPDSLRSIAYARVIDLISEGEIDGLIENFKSIYLDGVPLQSKDGTFNYKDIVIHSNTGTQDQPYIPGIPSSEAESGVGVDVKFGQPITQSISDQNTNACRVRIGIPQLHITNTTNGDVTGTEVEIQISVQNNGGGYVIQDLQGKGKFKGKCTSMYERDYRIELPSPGPWNIRVTRLTPDSSTGSLSNKTYWQTMTTINDTKMSYPNSALVMLQLPSDQFQSIPLRSYRIRGIKCKVPMNYDPYTRKYSTTGPGTTNGDWDGTFKVSWTSNPAWHFYDLLTKSRYGLGNFINANHIDKWNLYSIAKYNDAFVLSGIKKKHTLSVTAAMSASSSDNSISRTTGSFGGSRSISLANVTAYASGVDGNYYKKTGAKFSSTFRVGDVVTVSGFEIPSNNGSKTVIAVSDDSLVVGTSQIAEDEYIATNTVFSVAEAGDGLLDGDEVLLTGWTSPKNNGRAIIKQVTGVKIIFTDEIDLDDEASGSRTITVQDYTEPRFACNLYLQSAADAYKVVGNLASIFQSITYWAGGSIMLAQDAPRTPEYLFTNSNVEGGIFSYSGTPRKARHTVAVVTWNDPDDHFKVKYKYVTHEAGLLKYGYRPTQVAGFGCTSEGQAARIGKWLVKTEIEDTQMVMFKTGLEGAMRTPGAIVKVLDSYKAGKRAAGRILAATTTSVTVDGSPYVIEAGKSYTMSCVLPDGSVEEKAITNGVGTYATLSTAAFSVAPVRMAVWVITATDLAPRWYRIVSVNEAEPNKYEITAITHSPNKFAEVETGIVLEKQPTTLIPSLAAPSGLKAVERLYFGPGGQVQGRIDVTWAICPGAAKYLVRWNRNFGNWVEVEVPTAHFEILDATPGEYSFAVSPFINGNTGGASLATLVALGKVAPPADVTGFVAILNRFTVALSWNMVADIDFNKYEVRQGTTWSGGAVIAQLDTNHFTLELTSGGSYTFWVAAIDSSGNYSVTPSSAVLSFLPTTPTTLTMTDSPTPPP